MWVCARSEDGGKERAQPFTCGSFTSRLYEQE